MVFHKRGRTNKKRVTLLSKILRKTYKMAQNNLSRYNLYRVNYIGHFAKALIQSPQNVSDVRDLNQIKNDLEKYLTSASSRTDPYIELVEDPIPELKQMIKGLIYDLQKCPLRDNLIELAKLDVFTVNNEIRRTSLASDIRTSESGASGRLCSSDSVFTVNNEIRRTSLASDIRTSESGASGRLCSSDSVFTINNEIRRTSLASDIRTSESGASGTFGSSDSDAEPDSYPSEVFDKKPSDVFDEKGN